MEVLAAAVSYVANAKANLIRAGIELNKIPVPMQHGCKLLRMVADLDKIEHWLRSSEAEKAEASAVRAKPKRRSRVQKKIDQSHPVEGPSLPTSVVTRSAEVLSSFTKTG